MRMEGTINNLGTLWKFRDEQEYLVTLVVLQSLPKSVSVKLSNKITAEEWTGQFDDKYIETLTQRTGNYKPFDTFVAMVKCAILKRSDAVTLELMSYEDLVSMRERKRQARSTSDCNGDVDLVGSNSEKTFTPQSGWSRDDLEETIDIVNFNKYLIVTYTAEFDKVHYPLKLNYTGSLDVTVMHRTIVKLKTEIDNLRSTNQKLSDQLNSNTHNPDSLDHNEVDNTNRAESTVAPKSSSKSPQGISQNLLKKLKSLASKVCKLEDELETERKTNSKRMAKLQSENDHLRSKVRAFQASESLLQRKVGRLESALALNMSLVHRTHPEPHLTSSHECHQSRSSRRIGHQVTSGGYNDLSQYVSRNSSLTNNTRCSSSTGTRRTPRNVSTRRSFSNEGKISSTEAFKLETVRSLSRSSSCDKKSVFNFNPTEYVNQKKLKQQLTAQMRLVTIESRIREKTQRRSHVHSRNTSMARDRSTVNTTARKRSASEQRFDGLVRGTKCRDPSTDSSAHSSKQLTQPRPLGHKTGDNVNEDFGRPIIHQLLDNFNKSNSVPDSPHAHKRQGRLNGSSKDHQSTRDPYALSSLSMDQVQRRLQSIHAFLGKAKRTHSKK